MKFDVSLFLYLGLLISSSSATSAMLSTSESYAILDFFEQLHYVSPWKKAIKNVKERAALPGMAWCTTTSSFLNPEYYLRC